MPIDRIGREHVLKTLVPLWGQKIETARKLRQYIKAVFAWAQSHGFIEANNAGEVLDAALPKMPAVQQNHRALPYEEIPALLETIESCGASMSAKLAFRFLVLTACRGGEVRGALWDEIDLGKRTWTIPASRMKSNREHRVPLSDEAVEVLEQAEVLRDGAIVFPSPLKRGRALSNMTMTKILRDLNLADRATAHGMRSSFRTWAMEETNTPREIMEMALAHNIGSAVERSYARGDLFAKRRALMERWARFACGSQAAKVVSIRGA